jgi:hypothetical protein
MSNKRASMLRKMINFGESCLIKANGDRFIKQHEYDYLKKGDLITKEDYQLAIHRLNQKISWMNNSITHFKEAVEMLQSLSK